MAASIAGTAPGTGAPPASPGRVVFIDLARAVAVLLMVQGHTIDALLHPDFRWSVSYNAWLFVRGLTSCTFLFLSGTAFSITAIRHWDQQRSFTPRWFRRVRRFEFGSVAVCGRSEPADPDVWQAERGRCVRQGARRRLALVCRHIGVWNLAALDERLAVDHGRSHAAPRIRISIAVSANSSASASIVACSASMVSIDASDR